MKSRTYFMSILMVLILCCMSLAGCNNKTKKIDQKEIETSNADVTEACTPDNDADSKGNEEADDASSESESGEEELKETISWEQIKEIKPSEKSIKNRFAGFFNENLGIATYQYGRVFYTNDGGETWTAGKNTSNCIAGLDIIDEKNAFMTANYSEVRISKDGGVNWTRVPEFGDMKNEHCRFVSFIDPNTGWIANKKELGFTKDAGQTWESIAVPQSLSEICAIWLSSTTEGYILSVDAILYATTDGGKTWAEKDLGLKGLMVLVCPTVAIHFDDQQNFQMVAYLNDDTDKGFYYLSTVDGGDSWAKKELILEEGPGYTYLNRDSSLLTISDKTSTIHVYRFVE